MAGDLSQMVEGVVGVEAEMIHLAVNLDETLHEDLLDLLLGKSVLETVTENEDERKALTELVRASGRARGLEGGNSGSVRMSACLVGRSWVSLPRFHPSCQASSALAH